MPAAVAVPAALGIAGIGASIYGANKNAQAMTDANNANIAAQREANQLNYQRWLESQGVGANGQAVNTFLPRYFAMGANTFAPRRRFVKSVGSGATPAAAATGTGAAPAPDAGAVPDASNPAPVPMVRHLL